MGKPAEAHLPALPGTFAPPEGVEQVPRARRGVKAPPTRLGRLRADLAGLTWLSGKQLGLAPYLSSTISRQAGTLRIGVKWQDVEARALLTTTRPNRRGGSVPDADSGRTA